MPVVPKLLFFSVYVAPGAAFQPEALDALLEACETTVIGGDFNAKHRSWGCRTQNQRGARMRAYLDQKGNFAVSTPDDPTYYPPRIAIQPDILDFFLLQEMRYPTTVTAADDLSSDHVPVLLTIDATPTTGYPPTTQGLRTDWKKYSELLDSRLEPLHSASDPAELDLQVTSLTTAITDALEASSRPSQPRHCLPPVPNHIREAIVKKRRLRRIWQKTRHPLTKRAFNKQCTTVKNLLYDYRAAS